MTDLSDIREEIPPPQPEAHTRAQIFLINDHYRRLGCFSWDARKFRRLAAAGKWTERELGAMVGLSSNDLARCLKGNRFTLPVGILLTFLERCVRYQLTGYDDGQDLFTPTPASK